MNPNMFRKYDIRGIAGSDMNKADVFRISRAIGLFLHKKGARHLAVGRDCRESSPAYGEELRRGLLSAGCRITDIGICPTPLLYFTIHHLETDGGVMLTASHNPKEYNGFKICHGLESVHGPDLQEIRRLAENMEAGEISPENASEDAASGKTGPGNAGTVDHADVLPAYIRAVTERVRLSRPLRVGVDAGNGAAGVTAVPVLEALGCEVHPIHCELDGRFPNHDADPTVLKNLTDLIALVKEKKLDLGIGFDGDGDRIGVVDDAGEVVYGDQLMVLYAREILSRKPGAVFISEVKCSKVMYDEIKARGGRAVMWKTGHSLIKAKMKAEGAALAGEMSGHMFFADRWFGFDDATYAAARLLEIIAASDRRMGEMLSDLPKTVTTPEIRVDCPDDKKFHIVEKAAAQLKARYPVVDIDGVRVLFDDGWGLVRASNTQPALVLRFEAMTEERLAEIRAIVEGAVKDVS
ncbi:MAG: phosphomannomutase [Desulfobacterales bacterium]|nr:MAG: phosphomannomutase [Desulfobacterales bacterium]